MVVEARVELVRAGPQAGDAKFALGVRDDAVRATFTEQRLAGIAPRVHFSSCDRLLRLLVAHAALDDAAGHEREIRGRAARSDLDVLRLRRVIGAACTDGELAL